MGTPGLVLIHSPLVGPSSWQPVAEELRVGGLEVVVPSLVHALGSPPPLYQALSGAVVDVLDGCRAGGGPVLVVHSGAGALVPSVVDAAPGPVPDGGVRGRDAAPPGAGVDGHGTCRDRRAAAGDGRC